MFSFLIHLNKVQSCTLEILLDLPIIVLLRLLVVIDVMNFEVTGCTLLHQLIHKPPCYTAMHGKDHHGLVQ